MKRTGIQMQVLRLLQERPMTSAELACKTGSADVRKCIQRLRERHVIVSRKIDGNTCQYYAPGQTLINF